MPFTPTRPAALSQLENFLPHALKYAVHRNFDKGPGAHTGVSQLSPYIRTRLITEEEAALSVIKTHGSKKTDKFLQEIAWRTYWKGWLEMRPDVWDDYTRSLPAWEKTSDYETALSAYTGIECFDHWVTELRETGYLHNHARMWFASIWIFTLGLPWQLGADFFLTHLLDADPASNTLSWRWVAGLHTKGKHYLARASNIEKFTGGRFNPEGELNESAQPIQSDKTFEKQPLDLPPPATPQGRIGHLVFPEDMAAPPEEIGEIAATAAFVPPAFNTTPLVSDFINGAALDTVNRAKGTLIQDDFTSALNDWISAQKLDSVVISYPTVGLTRDFLNTQELPIPLTPFVRQWDRQLWPHATAGFFKLKKSLPGFFETLVPAENDLPGSLA